MPIPIPTTSIAFTPANKQGPHARWSTPARTTACCTASTRRPAVEKLAYIPCEGPSNLSPSRRRATCIGPTSTARPRSRTQRSKVPAWKTVPRRWPRRRRPRHLCTGRDRTRTFSENDGGTDRDVGVHRQGRSSPRQRVRKTGHPSDGEQRWAVIISGGYNNSDSKSGTDTSVSNTGRAYLFIIFLKGPAGAGRAWTGRHRLHPHCHQCRQNRHTERPW